MPLFLNFIISLYPLCLYTLRTTSDGDSLTASAPPRSIYRRGQSTAEEERQRTQPGTAEARHTEARHSRRRQLHHIASRQGRQEETGHSRRQQQTQKGQGQQPPHNSSQTHRSQAWQQTAQPQASGGSPIRLKATTRLLKRLD